MTALPLSHAQRRLWFLEHMGPGGAAYHLATAVRLTGPVSVRALGAALADVVERHEPLRTVYSDEPRQIILEPALARPELTVTTVSADELDDAVRAATSAPFRIDERPPFRAALFRTGPEDHLLVLTAHHIAVDGWSIPLLIRDLGTAYRARAAGLPGPDWPELPVRYSDYTLWQRELLGDPTDPRSLRTRQTEYWTRVLADLPDTPALPTDRPRPATARHHGARAPLTCDPERYRDLVRLAHEHRCTSFMAVHALLAVLLGRLGADDDSVLGAAVSGRTEEPMADLVGFFVNTLVLRTDLSGDPTFRQVLDRVRQVDLDAYAHQDLPFDLLVEALNPSRSLAHHPLFQVLLAFESHEAAQLDFGALRAERHPVDGPPAAKVDLTFQLTEDSGLTGYLEYDTDLFEPDTAEAIPARLNLLLDAVVADPDRPVADIDLRTPDERELIAAGRPDDRGPVTTLPQSLADQAARTPDAPAVVCGATTLTYADLHARADELAARLAETGAAPGGIVAVAMPRSLDFVIAILAVLKSGCAYLPVDPELPTARVEDMLAETRPVCVLTEKGIRVGAPGRPGASAGPPLPEHPAYVIHTSGSTGRPKGVVVPHAAIDNRLRWMQDEYPLQAGDRVLHKTPAGFDVSVWELFWPLREGAVMVVAGPDEHRDPARLARTIREQGVTIAHFVPSMLDLFLGEPEAADCTGLRRVFASGEALPTETARRFHETLPEVSLVNLYGPTEAAVDVTHQPYDPADDGPVPIGLPVARTRTYVLDKALRPCPPGVPGELYLAGAQLADGYLRRPALSATRFVADPYGPPGSRMYRTGDIVRQRRDGVLLYLGRTDQQVKLHGRRLELGEIESLLRADGSVGNCCAVLHAAEQRLIAYVTPGAQAPPDPARLRARLAERLPAAAVPNAIVVLDRLPLTPNGKLDRAALPLPAPPTRSTDPDNAPRTPQEKAVARAFAAVLGLPEPDRDTDFFGSGGHSLLAVRLARRLREEFGTDVPVQAVFRWPTVAGLARNLADASSDGTEPLLTLRSGGEGAPLFFVHPGTGLSWCYHRLLEHVDTDRPAYALQAPGLSGRELPTGVEEMADDYLRRIRQIQPEGPYHLLGWSLGGRIAHAMAVRLRQSGEQVGLLALFDSHPTSDDPADDDELTRQALANLCDGHDDVGFAEIRARVPLLTDAEPDRIRAVLQVGVTHLRLAQDFVPDCYDGDLVLLTARGAEPPDLGWSRFVTGRVTVVPVDCGHYDMFTTAVERTGRLLDPFLAVPAPEELS
ncbi:Dimodular nonribosomal peptide synthase [Streptomyces davaonensis JCM 4913]|uniref:Dimodular nonribosomal peptide synthase n=1 Tax=Streptomyces davaonensis (strain DSM 101723 / JCM 4913 / KCC S-0913 / 768) TaxID=1214101 RepID=K4RF06_STRDJ|nr:non-ribosomal peptide synthetase [Streptomyces davaonensis]CCK32383.1 Dimodular nonribosomal peptide synthase [Streptomyces davaonensis JCM 4913]